MSVNLMDLAKGYLGKQIMSQIGGILGESPEKTESAIGGALPAILGGLMKKASTPSGADEIFRGLDDQDDGILDNLGDLLGGNKSAGLMEGGSAILKMLFGGGLSSIIDLLTKSSGMGGKSLTSLLGILAPIVMGMLKRQSSSQGLDAAGLASMLMGQKDFLGDAIGGELGSALGLSSLTDKVTGAVSGAADAVGDAASNVAGAAAEGVRDAGQAARHATEAGGSIFTSLFPLIAILGLALIGWKLFSNPAPVDSETPAATQELETAADGSELEAPVLNQDAEEETDPPQ